MIQYRELDTTNPQEISYVSETDHQISSQFDSWNTSSDEWLIQRKENLVKLDRNKDFFLLALNGNEIVGFHHIGINKWNSKIACIYTTWVNPEWRKQKIAFTLKSKGEIWAKEKNIKHIITATDTKNDSMKKLNEDMGFKPFRINYVKHL